MRKFLVITIILSVFASLIAVPVLAAVSFSQNITLTEMGATAFTDLPMGVAFNTASIVSSGYMAASGLDSSVYDNGTALPTMFTNSSILFVDSLDPTGSSGSTVTDVLKTGQTPKSSMPIIVGNGGYVTTTDNAALEPGSAFNITVNGYLNTTAGASENIVSKTGALVVNVDPSVSGTIDANCGGSTTVSQTSLDYNPTLYGGSNIRFGERITAIPASDSISSIQWYLGKIGSPTGTISCLVRNSSTDAILGTIGTMSVASLTSSPAYYTFNTTPVNVGAVTDIRIDVEFSGGDSSNCVYCGDCTPNAYAGGVMTQYNGSWSDSAPYDATWQNLIYSFPSVSVSGISSGVGTLSLSETTTAGGTVTLSWTPQGGSANTNSITGVGSVPDTANNWIIDLNNVMPYMTSYVYTVGGVENIKYQPATIIAGTALVNLDSSGAYPGAITFGTNNAAVTVVISGSFGPLTPASYNSSNNYGPQTPGSIDLGNPIQPPTMYTGLTTNKFPFGTAIDAILDAGQVPHALFWYPFIFLFIVIVSMLGYDATQSTGGQGSLLTQCIIAEVLLVIFGVLGDVGVSSLIPLWPAFLFPLPAVAMMMSRRHVGWG